jgi:dUTPase
MSAPRPIKMKMADPEETTAMIIAALKSDGHVATDLEANEVWRSISTALVRTGCVIFQLDPEADR